MAAVDITRDYFNSLNCKKMTGYKDKCHSGFKKSNLTMSPNETTEILLDDSGYISPEFLHITPFHPKIEIQYVSMNVSNHRKVVHSVKTWEEPEEEDVAGKMQLRKGRPVWKNNNVQLELSWLKFTKKFAEMFDNENIIGKRIGRQNCNIISKLHKRNVNDFLTKLMVYMSPKDICNMCLVNKSWLECCKMNPTAQQKLKEFRKSMKIKRSQSNKENIIKVLLEKTKHKPKRLTKSELFKQCANTLKKDECLQKCPKCDHPAKVRPVQECGVCMNSTCGYHYCSKCRAKYHGSDLCFQVGTKRLTKEIVNTRTAKKYLRRL